MVNSIDINEEAVDALMDEAVKKTFEQCPIAKRFDMSLEEYTEEVFPLIQKAVADALSEYFGHGKI
jgi:hypothetical protein